MNTEAKRGWIATHWRNGSDYNVADWVLVSSTLRDLVIGSGHSSSSSAALTSLKVCPGEWRLFAVASGGVFPVSESGSF